MDDEILLLKTAVIEENRENGREIAMAATIPVENRNGFAFGVAKAKSRSVFSQTIMGIIHDRLTRLADTLQESNSIPRRFEQTLEAINEEIAAQATEMETFNPEELDSVIGLAVDKTLYLSGTGEMPAIFLHKLPEGRFQVFNLARSIQNEQAAINWQKIFVVVLDGDLTPGDVLCICSHDLQREMPPEELHSLLATLPPQSATVKLRQYFPLEIDLSMFVLRVGSEDDRPRISAPASLKQLQASREQTKRVMSDQKPTFLKTFFSWTFALLKNQRGFARLLKSLIRITISSVAIIFFMVRDFIHWLFRLTKRLISSERKEVFKETRSYLDSGQNFVREKFHRLPKTSKYLLLTAIALIIIIVSSVLMISRGRVASEERAAFEAIITRVESLHDAAESALIYKDENKAKSLLTQAETAINAIVTDDQDQLTRIAEIKATISTTTNELRRVIEIENPEILASTTNIENPPTLSAMTLTNSNLYIFGNNKNVYILNSNDKKLDYVAGTEFSAATGATTDNNVMMWLDDKSVINLLDTAPDNLPKTGVSAPTGETWIDLYAYADRVYVLSPGSGLTSQIYKFTRTGTNLSSSTTWIKSPITELSDSVSLAVDGTVFVLRSNGKILRFVSGRDVAWTQATIEPALTSASDIWTSAESSYVYVLDPVGQRLVVYEKESGNLKAQYHSTAFSNLTDFAVDEINKTIYLLGTNNVYKIEASHLK